MNIYMSFLPVKDNASSYVIKKELMFDLPFRLLLCGKSFLSGKSTAIVNLLLRPYSDTDEQGKDFYKNDFSGSNIYIVNPSLALDDKYATLIHAKKIPEGNIYVDYDEEEMMRLYEKLREQHDEELKEGTLKPKLIILDDCAFSGSLKDKQYGFVSRVAANGRHLGISLIVTSQKYSAVNTLLRENLTGLIVWESSNKQLDLIYEDHSIFPKSKFDKMFRDCTREKHSFMVINYSNPTAERFMDCNFQPINVK